MSTAHGCRVAPARPSRRPGLKRSRCLERRCIEQWLLPALWRCRVPNVRFARERASRARAAVQLTATAMRLCHLLPCPLGDDPADAWQNPAGAAVDADLVRANSARPTRQWPCNLFLLEFVLNWPAAQLREFLAPFSLRHNRSARTADGRASISRATGLPATAMPLMRCRCEHLVCSNTSMGDRS